jgi:hypothetical protein
VVWNAAIIALIGGAATDGSLTAAAAWFAAGSALQPV